MTLIPGIRRLFRLGGVHDVESAVDDELRADWWSALGQDLRYALRGLRLRPGFTAGVVFTLGLGIGANATMFGIVDRLLLRPPAYLAHPGRVHRVHYVERVNGVERAYNGTSYPRLLDMRRLTSDFDVVAGMGVLDLAVGTGESVSDLRVSGVTADFWRLFDMRPALGRFFAADEDSTPETSHVVVLGYGFWRSRYGGDTGVLGQRLRIGRNDYTIVGVAPRGFQGLGLSDQVAVIPMTALIASEWMDAAHATTYRTNYGSSLMSLVARRRAGVTPERANSDLSAAFRRSYERQIAERPGSAPAATAQPHAIAAPVQRARGPNRGGDVNVAIWLLGVTAIVLLIACANVGNLLLARAFGRRREIAVRLALGAGRGRLLAQLLTESLVLAALGGALGLVLSLWGGGVLRAAVLPGATWTGNLADSRALLACGAVALFVGLVTGLAPAIFAARSDVAAALKSGAREGTLHRAPLRAALLMTQGALSVVLLVGAGLFVRSLRQAQAVPVGYEPDRVLYVATELRDMALPDERYRALQRELLERAEALPGVERASHVLTVPFWSHRNERLYVAGVDSVSRLGTFEEQRVSPEYFATVGTLLVRGRGIEAQDREGAPPVMVVSRTMARALWPGREALGQCVRVGADTMPCNTVIGIAEDTRTRGLRDDDGLQYYLSFEQHGAIRFLRGGLFLRTRGEAAAAVNTVRRTLQELMPGAAYVTVTPLGDLLAPERRSWKLGATMFTVFGALALLVAAVGLYSVVSYGVAQRSQELAVRTALGAQARDIVRMVVGEGLRTAVVATGVGLAAAWFAALWVGPLLFQTSPRDPVVFGGVAVLLVVVALVASAIPALGAARVDPVAALRAD